MTLQLAPALLHRKRTSRVHFDTMCWKITRLDGQVFRFTTHDRTIRLDAGDGFGIRSFPASGGWDPSAQETREGLNESNLDVVGALTTDLITEVDVARGRFDEAQVDLYYTDWRVPWHGPLAKQRYWIEGIEHDGYRWDVKLSGLHVFLRTTVGRITSVECPYTWGDGNCGVLKADYTQQGTVSEIEAGTQRVAFVSTDLPNPNGLEDGGYYTLGEVVWTSGNNAGLRRDVKAHDVDVDVGGDTGADRQLLTLTLQMPAAIKVGDTFTINPGCNKLSGIFDTDGDCLRKYGNLGNFGGDPFSPGNVALLDPVQ